MSAARRHLVLVNPAAGGGRATRQRSRLELALRAQGVANRILLSESAEHAVAEARAAAGRGETVVVMSGDGLIGQVGGELAGSGAALAIVPAGRGNDLARVLGIPASVEAAAAVIAGGHRRAIDVGEVNGRRFLGIASCGFDSEANRIANETRLVRGNLVYLYAALRALVEWRPARFAVTLDGERRELTGYAVAAANNRAYGGGMFVAPRAELDDGLLDVVLTAHTGKLRFLSNLPKVFKGAHVKLPEVSVVRAAEVRIEADRAFAVYADGDRIADLPATVRVLPRALDVVVPAVPQR